MMFKDQDTRHEEANISSKGSEKWAPLGSFSCAFSLVLSHKNTTYEQERPSSISYFMKQGYVLFFVPFPN